MKKRQAMKIIYGVYPYHEYGVRLHRHSTWRKAARRLQQQFRSTCGRWRRDGVAA